MTRLFDLGGCEEVHSVPMGMLDDMGISSDTGFVEGGEKEGEAYVFEIELAGGVKERFAAGSIKERGAWVSAIWSVICPKEQTSTGGGYPA